MSWKLKAITDFASLKYFFSLSAYLDKNNNYYNKIWFINEQDRNHDTI